MGLAAVTQTPEICITEKEAKQLAEATKRLAEIYPIGMSQKALAWTNFIMVAGGIYGTRAIVLYKKPRAAKPNVTPINSAPKQSSNQAQTPRPPVGVQPMPSFEGKAPSDLFGTFSAPIG